MSKTTKRIVRILEEDFTDRRGLRQEWENIDDDVKKEIFVTWEKLIDKELHKSLKVLKPIKEYLECVDGRKGSLVGCAIPKELYETFTKLSTDGC